jgi:transposase
LEKIAPQWASESDYRRKRAFALTFHLLGIPNKTISEFFGYSRYGVRRFVRRFKRNEFDQLFGRPRAREKKHERKDLKDRLFSVMHAPPASFDVNRTTWTIDLLRDVLEESGVLIGKNTISKMIRSEGYNFRKTREVLTSNDPLYREKLARITRILRRLGPADRFFSIDEYGPFSVKERGGRRRVRKGEYPTIPQYHDSKGFIIVTAALELASNQVTHFYSGKKDTQEMITLLHVLLDRYGDCRRTACRSPVRQTRASHATISSLTRRPIDGRVYLATRSAGHQGPKSASLNLSPHSRKQQALMRATDTGRAEQTRVGIMDSETVRSLGLCAIEKVGAFRVRDGAIKRD